VQDSTTGAPERRRSPITVPGHRAGQPAPNKGMKLPPEPLTRAEVDRLMAGCSSRTSTGIRDRALIAVLYRAGLRISEALALQVKDVDLDRGLIVVLLGKGKRRRVAALDPTACALLERWMVRRATLNLPATWLNERTGQHEPAGLFCVLSTKCGGVPGKPVYSSVFRDKLKRLAKQVGIDKRVHPHGFRHTHAFELATENTPVHVIRKQLGHESLDTTARYVDHLAPGDVIATMRGRDWETQAAPEPQLRLRVA
jgi:integrase